jgi:dipeptidyl aminopeptidase/acylaminoacyl peptidase
VLLQAPRRSPAFPSDDGKLALFTQSTYSFSNHSKTNEIYVLDIASGQATLLTKDPKASEPKWLSEHDLVWLKETENGNTSFVVSNALEPEKHYTAGTVPGPVSNLKLHVTQSGMVAIAVSGQANPDGNLHNPKDVPKSHTSAKVYKSLFVRHWDHYVTAQRNAIFTAILQKSQPHVTERKGRYNLLGFKNAIRGTGLESPIPPFGGTDHFDISSKGIVLVAKDPDVNPATHTKCNVYFVPKEDLMDMGVPEARKLEVPGLDGAASCPVFSPDGESIACLKMAKDGYESDKNRIVMFHQFSAKSVQVQELLSTSDGHGAWDRSPSAIMFSNDGKSLLIQAEEIGKGCLFQLDLAARLPPRKLTSSGYILDVVPLAKNTEKLLVSSNSLIDNSIYQIIDPTGGSEPITVSSNTKQGSLFGLSPSQVSSIWWKGANDHDVHAWMMKPSFFNPDKKYPLAYLIHGGPQGAWNDQWSTRWNPAVFAEQGYIVICPNPTGSTGYGQAFTDAIRNQWGGLPYEDLVHGFSYIEKELDFVDTNKAVALGASYGGYMMNWIQGHPLGRKFKALVCHDGVFSMTAQLASDEQYFPRHDLGGPLWENQENYDRWDPSRFTKEWNTPMLVVHNELDYRLTIAEGLAMFNVLQMRGVESLFLSFPDENHWVLKHENSLVWHLVVINWINRFVGLPRLVDGDGRDGMEYCARGR